MGLFKKEREPKICIVCGKDAGTWGRYETKYGECVCEYCLKLCGGFEGLMDLNNTDIKNIVNFINDKKQRMIEWGKYEITNKVDNLFEISTEAQMIHIAKGEMDQSPDYFLFGELMEYELVEDEQIVTKGGLGRAVVGGLLLGGTGAIVGGITGGKKTRQEIKKMYIKISMENYYFPERRIKLLTHKVTKDHFDYIKAKQKADKIISLLKLTEKKEDGNTCNAGSSADEILKYKNLLDMGVIMQEEFDKKKKQLLDL